jgi:hypothetical protein
MPFLLTGDPGRERGSTSRSQFICPPMRSYCPEIDQRRLALLDGLTGTDHQ